jgi:chaperonin cofactor prefoldin
MNVRQTDLYATEDMVSIEKVIAKVKRSNSAFLMLSTVVILLMFCAAAFGVHKSFEALNKKLNVYDLRIENLGEKASEVDAKAEATEKTINALLSKDGNVSQLSNSVADLKIAQEKQRRDIDALKASIQCMKPPAHSQQCP